MFDISLTAPKPGTAAACFSATAGTCALQLEANIVKESKAMDKEFADLIILLLRAGLELIASAKD
jgi:hypothetical protein